MPEAFERCRREKGRIRTFTGPNKEYGLKEGEYVHVCFDKNGGVWRGEVKKNLRFEMLKRWKHTNARRGESSR